MNRIYWVMGGIIFFAGVFNVENGTPEKIPELLIVGVCGTVVAVEALRLYTWRIYCQIKADEARTIAASSRPEETRRKCREAFNRRFS